MSIFVFKILKTDINSKVTGIASSSVREKMVTNILSDNYPSVQHCNMYLTEDKVSAIIIAGWPLCTVPYTVYGTGFVVYGTLRYRVGV